MLHIREARPEEYPAIGALTLAAYGADGFINAEHGYSKLLADVEARAKAAVVLVASGEVASNEVASNEVASNGVASNGVASNGSRVVGAVTYCEPSSSYAEISREDEAEFRMLAVDPLLRGRRVGEALVLECLARAILENRKALVLSVDRRNSAAARLYTRLGFTREPDRDWSPVPDVDLEVYRRDLSTPR